MIEQGAFPRGLIVTTVALLTLLAFVHIVLPVARVTCLAQVFLTEDILVTGSTLYLIVPTP